MSLIEVRSVSYGYGATVALSDVSFSVKRGSRFGVVGPNGGGKSTLFRLLSTLEPLQSGQIRINGDDLTNDTVAVRKQLGVVFQSPAIDKKLTVFENLRHQAWLYGISAHEAKARSRELVEKLGLSDVLTKRTETLSGGFQRRLEIAKALLHRPSVLLLDEPTAGLDPIVRRELWDYLQLLRVSDALTVVFTTHLLDEAENSDHVLMLDAGKVVAFDEPATLAHSMGEEIVVVRKPNLEDFFVRATGHRYGEANA